MKRFKNFFLLFGIFIFFRRTNQEVGAENVSANITSTTPLTNPAMNRTFMIISLLTFPPICIIGQFILVYIVYIRKRKKYRSSFFIFLLLLIIAALYWLFLLIYEGVCLILDRCPGGELLNIILISSALFFYDMCMWSTLFVSFNRFSAIFFVNHYEQIFSKQMTRVYVAMVIVGSGLVNCPNWIYLLKYVMNLYVSNIQGRGCKNFFEQPLFVFSASYS